MFLDQKTMLGIFMFSGYSVFFEIQAIIWEYRFLGI